MCDHIYYNLSFLEHKFLRRDHLQSSYQSICNDFEKGLLPLKALSEESNPLSHQRTEANYFVKFIHDITTIVYVRGEMVSIYRKLANAKDKIDYPEIVLKLEDLESTVGEDTFHPLLKVMRFNVKSELYIFHKLILAQIQMSNYVLKETILNLHDSKADLVQWKTKLEERDEKTKMRLPLYIWLNHFYASLLSKTTLLFNRIFESYDKETKPGHINFENGVNYIHMIESFCQKTECKNFFVILNASELSKANLNGYACPCEFDEEQETLTGLKSWPHIYSYPDSECTQWPSIISLLLDTSQELENLKNPLTYYDPTINITYNLIQIDEKLFIACLFSRDTRKNESITEFLTNIADHLKNLKIFERLTTKMS